MNRHPGLTTQKMNEVCHLFNTLIQMSYRQIPSTDLAHKTRVFFSRYSASPVSVWFTRQAIEDIFREILAEEKIHEFLMTLTTHFFARLGDDDTIYNLAKTLATAACIDGPYPEQSYLPQSLKKYLPSTLFGEYNLQGLPTRKHWYSWKKTDSIQELKDLLVSNKPLMVLMMINITGAQNEQ